MVEVAAREIETDAGGVLDRLADLLLGTVTLMLRDFSYEEQTIWVFLIVTVVLGGGAAWMAGRAVATVWNSWWMVVIYCAHACASSTSRCSRRP